MENTSLKQKLSLKNPVIVCLLAILCCALLFSSFPCIKIGYELFDISSDQTGGQILFAGIRFTLAGLMALAIGSISAKKVLIPGKKAVPKVLLLSLFQTVLQYFFFYIGLGHTTGVKSSIINGVSVFVAILVAVSLRMEKMTVKKAVGSILGFAGVVLINLAQGGLDFSFHLNGEGFIILATVAYGFSSVLVKRYSVTENPVMLSGWQFVFGGIIMIVGGFLMGGRLTLVTGSGIAMLCYLAFISAAAYSIWSLLLKYNPISNVAVFGFANPIFGVILSAILLKEGQSFGWNAIVALLLVSLGICVVYYQRNPKNTAKG